MIMITHHHRVACCKLSSPSHRLYNYCSIHISSYVSCCQCHNYVNNSSSSTNSYLQQCLRGYKYDFSQSSTMKVSNSGHPRDCEKLTASCRCPLLGFFVKILTNVWVVGHVRLFRHIFSQNLNQSIPTYLFFFLYQILP